MSTMESTAGPMPKASNYEIIRRLLTYMTPFNSIMITSLVARVIKFVGQAAVLGDRKQSTFVQSYGPEARGGSCAAQVIISDGDIHYPHVRNPDILVALITKNSQQTLNFFVDLAF